MGIVRGEILQKGTLRGEILLMIPNFNHNWRL